MKARIIYMIAAAALTALCSCEKDNPFAYSKGNGRLDTEAMRVAYSSESHSVRADEDETIEERFNPAIEKFTVRLTNTETNATQEYTYGDMPEIIQLEEGTYSVEAYKGDDPEAGWNKPYFHGAASKDIVIEADRTTRCEETVTCGISNILVSVDFSKLSVTCDDLKVSVKTGESGTELDFTTAEDASKAGAPVGCFKYVGSNTLIATFTGSVNGNSFSQLRTFEDVEPGNHYKISFNIIVPVDEDTGVSGTIQVNTEVESEDVNFNIIPDDEEEFEDFRPHEDQEEVEP